jgi:hypothetical protein
MPQSQGSDKHKVPDSEVRRGPSESRRLRRRTAPGYHRAPMAAILGALALATSLAAPAAEVAGIRFEEHVRIADGQPELVLNGVGIRTKFFVKVYAAGLYLPKRAGSTGAILQLPGPKRVRMHFIHSEVAAEKIRDAWTDGFRENLSDAEYAALADRIERFNGLFPTLKAGDVVDVDYIPGSGTAVRLNGDTRGIIPGEDFYPATLRIWLGDSPAHRGLKKAMLGQG